MTTVLGIRPPSLLQAVLDDAGVGLAIIDHDGKFAFTNRSIHAIFGMTQDLDGMSLIDWSRNYKFQDAQGVEIRAENAPVIRALAGEEVEPQDIRVTLPNGDAKWVHTTSHPFSVLGLTGVFVLVTDETEQVELRRANERIQRIEAVGRLVGGLAHNFNNMLSVASENIAVALFDSGISSEMRASLQQGKDALHKAAALAKKLVQFSRPGEFQMRVVDVNEVVNASLELARPLLGNRVRLNVDLQEGLPDIQADPVELEQALVNFILNAWDAMPQGGNLTVSTELVARTPSEDEKSKQRVAITVADTGIGIPAQLHSRIFEPFFTTKPEGKGSGMGLSSAYRIVHQHDGHITVESTPGAGATFRIFLPVKDEGKLVSG